MAISSSLLDLLRELLAPIGPVVFRNMFGGAGVYCDGVIFGLIDADMLYFKADDESKRAYEAEGYGPFVYDGHTGPVAMSYWRVPERLFDEPDEMADWARTALSVARRARVKKPTGKKKSGGAAPAASSKRKSKPRK